ncbi:HD-GYP domain-containing protein [Novosphingobium bradum]|uniref:HD-GYP domain-containing protein n=1 Tax=Novosphingobium bradum TaxID=1737444 RepID=A0ABV7IUQ3_9SPHN
MLKRIETDDVELGMFIHRLEGNWFRHPFWKARFLLEDETLLQRLRHSAVPGVIIDTARSAAPAGARPSGSTRGAPAESPILRRGARRAAAGRGASPDAAEREAELRSLAPRTMAREFGLANRVAERSRRAINRTFLEARLGKAVAPSAVEPVVDDVFASIQRNAHAFNGLMRCKRDTEFVYRHALSVCALMISLGRAMKLEPREIRMAGMAGLLLDVGVGHLPQQGELSADFRDIDPELFRVHVKLGHDLLYTGGMPEAVTTACLQHHERLDGSGYPLGLAGEVIGRYGRMAAICDTYDWLVDDSGGHPALDPAAAIEHLARPGSGFDPELVMRFTEAVGIHPIGAVVELESGRLAMVVAQDDSDPTRPRVRTFWSRNEQRALPPSDIALAQCFGEDRIVGRADLASMMPGDFAPLRERLFAGSCAGG